jgi:hypothetical protein
VYSYPSLLESSDVDGGSSVAVLTYLRRILEALDHPDMIHLILHYLLALEDTGPAPSGSRAAVSAARKRKSMDLATMMLSSQSELASTPRLFNLVDLIHGSLESQSEQTKSVTLQLLSVILKRHHRYAVTTLLRTSQVLTEGPERTIAAHEMDMELLLDLAGDIGGEDNFDEVYENHVKDCMSILESHPCSITLIAPKPTGGTSKFPGAQASISGAPRDIRSHTLRHDDPMLKILLGILVTFFTNSIETNLSLTGAIVDLATCGFMRIDGWLLPDPSKYTYEEEDEDPEQLYLTNIGDQAEIQERLQLQALKQARKLPKNFSSHSTPLLNQLKTLVSQVAAYKSSIPRFEDLLQQRREAFQSASSATSTPFPPSSHQPTSQSRSSFESESPPARSAIESLAQRIFPELQVGTPSRSMSPRGRKTQDRSTGFGIGTPTTVRRADAPPQFPMSLDTGSRGSSRAFSPSPLRDPHVASRRDDARISQSAAFMAVDQGILARKVGIPSPPAKKVGDIEVTPIPFPNLKSGAAGEATEGIGKASSDEDDVGLGESKMVSVNHVLTNVLLLQEFLLELAALVQVRAGLFGEVRYI